MTKLECTLAFFLSLLSFAFGRLQCDGYKYVRLQKPVEFQSLNYPSNYFPYYFCGFVFVYPAGTRLEIQCSRFDVTGYTNRCYRGGVYSYEYSKRQVKRYCGRRDGLTMKFEGSAASESKVFFRMYNYYYSAQGFLCTAKPISLMQTTTTTSTTTKATTTKATTTKATTNDKTTTASSGFVCKCGIKNKAGRIVGGQVTGKNEYPWQVGLLGSSSRRPFCGGTLITDRHVVTAAHCNVQGASRVVIGEHNTDDNNDNAVYIDIQRFESHPDYNRPTRLNNDIALITLSEPVTFSKFIQPICLPTDLSDTFAGDTCTITGWGTTSEGGSASPVLKEAEVKVFTNDQCERFYGSVITDKMLCAGFAAGGTDSCQGDSGGPLACPSNGRLVLAGVTSFGNGCARPNAPGVYARVTAETDWIKSKISSGKTCD